MPDSQTPWRRVFVKFGVPQAQLAKAIGRHRSKVSRALKDDRGLINGRDQEALLGAAEKLRVDLTSADLTPGGR